jgi:hypothetical protein
MAARIFLDLDTLHLVSEGLWHRANLGWVPHPGEQVTMLCGLVEPVEYDSISARPPAARTCWDCDLVYRRHEGFAVLPDHPGIRR